jgi:hypothetical protein
MMDTLNRAGRTSEAAVIARGTPVGKEATDALIGVAGFVLARNGDVGDARTRLAILEARAAEGYSRPFWRSQIHIALEEFDDAFGLLDQAVAARDGGLVYMSVIPRVTGFQEDPRYGQLLNRIGLGHLLPGIRRRSADWSRQRARAPDDR